MSARVAIVEDDRHYRASLETLFTHAPDFEWAESFTSGDAMLEALDRTVPESAGPPWDLVLMDLDLPGTDGVTCTRLLKERSAGLPVVVVTVSEDPDTVLRAICAGADGYLAKRTPPVDLIAELRVVLAGGAPLSAGVARTVLTLIREPTERRRPATPTADLHLTEREQDVLRRLVQGLSYQRVADDLGISLDTVRTHVRRVYSKLQVHSVAQAVSRALREGLV